MISLLRAALAAALLLCAPAVAAAQTTYSGNFIAQASPVYDVRYYGALCNGSNDDTAAIQSAINAAGSAGGGMVWLPAGNCVVTSSLLVQANGVVLHGQGWRFDANNAAPTMLTYSGTGTEAVVKITSGGSGYVSNSAVENLAVTPNGNATYGVESLSNLAARLEHLGFFACAKACIRLGVAPSSASLSKRFTVLDLQCEGSNGDCIWYDGAEEGVTMNVLCESVAWCQHFGGGAAASGQELAEYSSSLSIESRGNTTTDGGIFFDCGAYANDINNVQSTRYLAAGTARCTGVLHPANNDHVTNMSRCNLASTLSPPYSITVEAGATPILVSDDCGNIQDQQVQAASGCSAAVGHAYDNGVVDLSGAGPPTCVAPRGSTYRRADGGIGTTFYISQGGGTWAAVPGV